MDEAKTPKRDDKPKKDEEEKLNELNNNSDTLNDKRDELNDKKDELNDRKDELNDRKDELNNDSDALNDNKKKHKSGHDHERKGKGSPTSEKTGGKANELVSNERPNNPDTNPIGIPLVDLNEKYDRQIRLFGEETQNKLLSMTVQVIGGKNLIPCEIIKNLALLGVNNLIVEEEALDRLKKIVPDDLTAINENLTVTKSHKLENCDFLFSVDYDPVIATTKDTKDLKNREEMADDLKNADIGIAEGIDDTKSKGKKVRIENAYYICSKCSLMKSNRKIHVCKKKQQMPANVKAMECLIGAFAVQEFLKIIQDKPYVEEFDFSLLFD